MRGVITGAGRGIGAAILRKMVSEGHEVLAITRTETDELLEVKSDCPKNVQIEIADITDYPRMDGIMKRGAKFSDFLICNAGKRYRKDFLAIDQADFVDLMNVNFFAQVNLIRGVIGNARRNNHKCSVVAITSIVGPQGFRQLTNYAATKGALEALIKSLAVEFAEYNIRLNCIAPGFVASSYANAFRADKPDIYQWTLDRTPVGRWGECSEVADLCFYLVSNKSSFITGQTVFIDGGWSSA